MLAWERETLGIFVSGHPLAEIAPLLARAGATPVKDLRKLPEEAAVTIAGTVTAVRRTLTKTGSADSHRADRRHDRRLRRGRLFEDLSAVAASLRERRGS